MLESLVLKYQRTLHLADITRDRMESLYGSGKLKERDIHTLYEGLFLRSVVGFENLLEQIFYAVLEGRSNRRAWRCKLTGPNRALRECVIETKPYLDWLPYDRTLERAKIYLKGAMPFAQLDQGDISKIKQVLLIRHAIAHPSTSAREKFQKVVIGSTPVPAKERSPAGFLRGFSRPGLRRYEVFVQSLGGIANKLH